MSKDSLADISNKIFQLIKDLSADERWRAMSAALVLVGDAELPRNSPSSFAGETQIKKPRNGAAAGASTAKDFFEAKQPGERALSKIEELAIAARFRELVDQTDAHSRDELRAVFQAARRNFDSKHYKRDIQNAKTAGLFNRSADNTLSHYGQDYVDALPDLQRLKELKKPTGTRRAPKRSKRAQ